MATMIQTSVNIQGAPEKVWSVLTDFTQYPEWNPFVRSVQGTVQKGKRIRVELTPPGQKGMTFTPEVLCFEPNRRFEWIGRFFIPGLFDGRHCFELQAHKDGTTTLIQSEQFRGVLVPFLKKMLNGPTRKGFEAMNEALRARVEQF